MMMSRLFSDSARAISTSCCSATDSAETGVSGSMVRPTRAMMPRESSSMRPPVDQPEPADRRAADEDVLRHRQRRDQAQFLVDGDDAEPLGVLRIGRTEFGAVEHDAAAGGRHHARQDLEQRRLAGAVLAEQAEDLAAAHVERDVAERGHAGKMLGHALDGEQHVVCGAWLRLQTRLLLDRQATDALLACRTSPPQGRSARRAPSSTSTLASRRRPISLQRGRWPAAEACCPRLNPAIRYCFVSPIRSALSRLSLPMTIGVSSTSFSFGSVLSLA